jgi:hypothetical protein
MNELDLRSTDKLRGAICTTGPASQFLDELRKSYQALAFEERKQVTAFISELSCAAVKRLGEQRRMRSSGASALLER